MPALTRLLQAGLLHELQLEGGADCGELFTGGGVKRFCDVLAASQLTKLQVDALHPVYYSVSDGVALINACLGHPTLRELSFCYSQAETVEQSGAFARALSAVLVAESALTSLDLSHCGLGDEGMAPLFAALAANKKLRTFKCRNSYMSGDGVTSCILPALTANASLRELELQNDPDPEAAGEAPPTPEIDEAEALVKGRTTQRSARPWER